VFGTNEDVQIVAKTESAESHCLVGKWQVRWNLGRNTEIMRAWLYMVRCFSYHFFKVMILSLISHNLEQTCSIMRNQNNKQDKNNVIQP
jgi:hypothetical protein